MRPKPAKHSEQQDCANRGNGNRRKIEPFGVVQAENARRQHPADGGPNYADNQVHEETVITPSDALREPSGNDPDNDARQYIHVRTHTALLFGRALSAKLISTSLLSVAVSTTPQCQGLCDTHDD